jgi:hypothetical protein
MLNLPVDCLWVTWDKSLLACVQKVHNYKVMHLPKNRLQSYAQLVHHELTVLMNTFFMIFTSSTNRLYTLSTQPIKTIYLYKGDL